MKKLTLIIILLLSVSLMFAEVLSVKDVFKLSKKGEAIIVSARNSADYASKHIKGAVNIYHKDLYASGDVKSMLKSTDEIAAIFGEKGISADSKIVIYDNGDAKLAGRLYWIFDYLGATDVNILDGHVKAWMKGRKPVTKNATEINATTFKANADASKIATMEYVKANLENANVQLLDVRSADEFNGVEEDEELSRLGHIPGAINLEYDTVVNEDGTLKTKEEIATLLTNVGVSGDKEIILYCASSVRAGIMYVALTAVMDFPNVKVYDGAFYEWNVSDNSVE
ncbi:MAG: sulfurtransferase [Candidatus Cloacimonetes bacterium]|jgi:thiosulfate/3-mercaptopyruvate sulfurtransferase|nr:sulfurtransferase [Candidatus Cloacimonadota bacterium]MBT6994130.1 sulfurtransferase [Candidatus Cloacimonadota bacterium]MBT7469002.1 sulfurtransferase [Candidatus Cloacimonadota bacterium]